MGASISSSILKKLLFVVFLIGFAAAWGYFSDEAKKSTTIQPKIKVEEEKETTIQSEQVKPAEAIPNKLQAPMAPQAATDDLPPLPPNPYEQLMKAVEPNINDSLNSLNSGAIKDDQVIRRNEYFEKLSQQLKELQGNGENPPSENAPKEGEPEIIEDKLEEVDQEQQQAIEEVVTDEQNPFPEEEIPDYEIPSDEELIAE